MFIVIDSHEFKVVNENVKWNFEILRESVGSRISL
jgi:hypothetical protein